MELRDLRGLSGIAINPYRIVGAQPGEHLGLPSSTITLIVDLDDGLDLTEPGRPDRRVFRCCLGGMHLQPVTIHHTGTQIGVAIALPPAAVRSLFGMPAGQVWATNLELGDAAPGLARRLYDAAGEADHPDRARATAAIFAEELRAVPASAPDPDAERAWQLIQETKGDPGDERPDHRRAARRTIRVVGALPDQGVHRRVWGRAEAGGEAGALRACPAAAGIR